MAKEYDLLSPTNCAVLFIDHQPQMAFAVESIDRGSLINNVVGLAKGAKLFNVPTVLTSVASKTFSGPLFKEILEVFPQQPVIDRTSMNSWEDEHFVEAVKKTGRKKLVIAGLWTEVCVVFPSICALEDGFEVYFVTDASGGVSIEAHERAVQRLIQAGAIPVTWLQVVLEFQRDWARTKTYEGVTSIVKQHAGAYGLGVYYAKAMLGEHASEAGV